jgi:hypothetical protein
MYLFLNHFAFTEPKENIQKKDIMDSLKNLGYLFIELKKIKIDIIIHQSLSQTKFINIPIRDYIRSLQNLSIKQSVIQLLGKTLPFCSDVDSSFENDEIISYANCKEEVGKIDVLYTFLSCAMYYNNPILTVNNLCNKNQFLQKTIKVICNNQIEYTFNNYQLIPYITVINKLKEYQKEKLLDKYNLIDNWDDYMTFVNTNFEFSRITFHCIGELKKRFSYCNSYAIDFRQKVQRIESFVKVQGGNVGSIDFNKLSKKHYAPESSTRFDKLKKLYPSIKNYQNEHVYLNWHTWIQDFRIYFEKEDSYVSYVHFVKKINF